MIENKPQLKAVMLLPYALPPGQGKICTSTHDARIFIFCYPERLFLVVDNLLPSGLIFGRLGIGKPFSAKSNLLLITANKKEVTLLCKPSPERFVEG